MTITAPAPTGSTQTEELAVRRLPVRVTPVPGESLDSWLTRSAYAVRATRSDLLSSFQLSREELASHTRWSEYVGPEVAGAISGAGGLAEGTIPAMTLSVYADRVIEFDRQMRVRRLRRWARGSNTRYCPQCLGSNSGALLLKWRLVWSFVCLEHRMMLRDTCPKCQSPIPTNHGRSTQMIEPGECAKHLGTGGSTELCRQWLAAAPSEVLPNGHPLLRAQLFIDQLINAAPDDDVESVLGDLQAVGRGIIAANLDDDVAAHAALNIGELSGLKPTEERPGVGAPKDALFMGAIVTWALRILSAPFDEIADELRYLILNFKDGDLAAHSSSSLGSPLEVVGRWGATSSYLRHRMLRSLDRDLKISDRLNLGTASSVEQTSRSQMRELDVAEIPTLIWPSLAVALDFGGRYNLDAFQRAMSVAVTLANTGDRKFRNTQRDSQTRAWRTMRPVFFGDDDQTTRIVSTVTAINLATRSRPPVIDYDRRRQLAGRSQFLTDANWTRIAKHINMAPGSTTRALMARRYAYLRFVSTADTDIPFAWMRANRRDDTALYTAFCTSMTEPLQREIDAYLASILQKAKVAEPVTWAPELTPEQLERIPGRRVDDIDYELLHGLLNGGERRLSVLAKRLDRSVRHVRVAIDHRPRPSAGPAKTLNWSKKLIMTPHNTVSTIERKTTK